MKIHIPNSSKDQNTLKGKSLFCNRLGKALSFMGQDIIDDPDIDVDVSINVIRLKHKKSKVKILRLNGVWHDTGKPYKQKNQNIANSLHKADGVIYQSQHSKRLCDEYLGKYKGPSTIIFNGADPDFYQNTLPVRVDYKNVFLTLSKWRPHKRLQDTIESFLLANIEDSVLYVAGDIGKVKLSKEDKKKYFDTHNVIFLGSLDQKQVASYLKISKALVHLCWFDACPNDVVEAITAKIPVICNNVGGTPELVSPSGGYVCNVDKFYDYKPVDLYHPPRIDRKKIADAMIKSCTKSFEVKNSHVLIKNIAEQYLSFMRKLVE